VPIDQTYAKRQRLNPLSKQEYTEETIGNTMAERSNRMQTIPIGGTSSISQIQALERLSKQSDLATTP